MSAKKTTPTPTRSPTINSSDLTWTDGAKIATKYLKQFTAGGALATNLSEAKATLARDFGLSATELKSLTSARLPVVVATRLLAATPARLQKLSSTPAAKQKPSSTPAAKSSAKPTTKPSSKPPRKATSTKSAPSREPKKKSDTDGMIDATVKIVEMIRKAANI